MGTVRHFGGMLTAAIISSTLGQSALARECGPPPVIETDHAICLARRFAERPTPPPWELEFEVKDAESHWLVFYGPNAGSGVRGGGGDLKIDKKSGEVIFLRGHR